MKTTLKNIRMCIEKINFDLIGKMSIKLEDGRILIIPLKYFPEIAKMPIVDDRTILFSHADSVYHLEDFIGLESKWKER